MVPLMHLVAAMLTWVAHHAVVVAWGAFVVVWSCAFGLFIHWACRTWRTR